MLTVLPRGVATEWMTADGRFMFTRTGDGDWQASRYLVPADVTEGRRTADAHWGDRYPTLAEARRGTRAHVPDLDDRLRQRATVYAFAETRALSVLRQPDGWSLIVDAPALRDPIAADERTTLMSEWRQLAGERFATRREATEVATAWLKGWGIIGRTASAPHRHSVEGVTGR